MPHPPSPSVSHAPGAHADSSFDATGAALARLASTRQRLLLRMAPHKADGAATAQAGSAGVPRRWRALGRMLMSRGPSAALLRAASAAVGQWWHAQPWSAATGMLGRVVQQEVTPVVRRHPWLSIVAALALGAAVVSARPWHWRAVRPYVAPLGARLRHGAWNLFTQAPVQMAVATVLAAWIGDRQRQAASGNTVPPPTAAQQPNNPTAR